MTPFLLDREVMTKVSNFALIKFTNCDASLREILFYLIWKVMFAWYWIERVPAETVMIPENVDCKFVNDGTWFLPKVSKIKNKAVHYDHMYIGWFCPPKSFKVNSTFVPFDKCKESMGDVNDEFYSRI